MYQIASNELYHYGILGQKWGVRRFQNPDGSLTEAGKKRYATLDFYAERSKRTHNSVEKYKASRRTFEDARDRYKNKEISKAEYKKSKVDEKVSKRKVNDRIKYEQGKELYGKGRSIYKNRALSTAGDIINVAAFNPAIWRALNGTMSRKMATITEASLLVGVTAANIALKTKLKLDNEKLRRYYAG